MITNSRRTFVKGLFATGILVQIPFYVACQNNANATILFKYKQMANSILSFIFPKKMAPGYNDINAYNHLVFVLNDPNSDADETAFIFNGFTWTNETAQETFQKDFVELQVEDKQIIFKKIMKESWGESWLSKLTTLIFEALLLDTLYKVNNNETGWKWLHHQPGLPRPTKNNSYPNILKRKEEYLKITNINQL